MLTLFILFYLLLITEMTHILRYSTPLHDAVCCGRDEIVKILVERGANVNELDYKNITPLKLAVRLDVSVRYEEELYFFVRYGQDSIEELLRSKGAKELVDAPKKISVIGDTIVEPP